MPEETFKVRPLDDGSGHVRISVDSAGEEARGVTKDPREAIQEIAEAAGITVSFPEPGDVVGQ